jgi:RimJ/RimL family protein N-acetyltransferase
VVSIKSLITPQLPSAFKYTLEDGTAIMVRPVRPEDAARLKEGFARLSQLARRRRFVDAPEVMTDEHAQKLVNIDQVNQVAWGAANLERPDEPGVGIARYVRLNGEADAADVAIVIADRYQGRGAGFVLQAALHLTAHRNGIRTFYYDVLTENDRIIKHLKLMGAEHAGRADNIDRLRMPVYHRAWDVPASNEIAKRFAEVFRSLQSVEELAAA